MSYKVSGYLLIFICCITFATGTYGLYSLYEKSITMEHTVGKVTHIKTERTYRRRKIYYKHTAVIKYNTKLHPTATSKQLLNPLISQDSEIRLWYNPDRVDDVIIPSEECIIWGCLWICGTVCLLLGIITIKIKKHEN